GSYQPTYQLAWSGPSFATSSTFWKVHALAMMGSFLRGGHATVPASQFRTRQRGQRVFTSAVYISCLALPARVPLFFQPAYLFEEVLVVLLGIGQLLSAVAEPLLEFRHALIGLMPGHVAQADQLLLGAPVKQVLYFRALRVLPGQFNNSHQVPFVHS